MTAIEDRLKREEQAAFSKPEGVGFNTESKIGNEGRSGRVLDGQVVKAPASSADLSNLSHTVAESIDSTGQQLKASDNADANITTSVIEQALNGGDLPSDKSKFLEDVLNMAHSGKE